VALELGQSWPQLPLGAKGLEPFHPPGRCKEEISFAFCAHLTQRSGHQNGGGGGRSRRSLTDEVYPSRAFP
jgi:hypothetical protein